MNIKRNIRAGHWKRAHPVMTDCREAGDTRNRQSKAPSLDWGGEAGSWNKMLRKKPTNPPPWNRTITGRGPLQAFLGTKTDVWIAWLFTTLYVTSKILNPLKCSSSDGNVVKGIVVRACLQKKKRSYMSRMSTTQSTYNFSLKPRCSRPACDRVIFPVQPLTRSLPFRQDVCYQCPCHPSRSCAPCHIATASNVPILVDVPGSHNRLSHTAKKKHLPAGRPMERGARQNASPLALH